MKIFEPTILPIAISAFPFLAAVTEATNSGSDVPKATIVKPINFSLIPIAVAIAVAAFTEILAPQTTTAPPIRIKSKSFQTGLPSVASSSVPFFAKKYR